MPRTAPVVDLGTPTSLVLSVSFIDYTGDVRTDSYRMPATVTDTEIDALVAALGADSDANLWKVSVAREFAADEDATPANNTGRGSVSQNLAIRLKNPAGDGRNVFVPAPIESQFIPDTDEIDPASATLAAVLTAAVDIMPAGFTARSVRFSGRREKNKAIKLQSLGVKNGFSLVLS